MDPQDNEVEETSELETGVEEESSSSSQSAAEVVSKAKGMGWVPKEQFRGDKSKWVSAEEYVRRGEQIIPIVKANVTRLEAKNNELEGELAQLRTQLRAATESIEALKELNSKANIDEAKDARRQLIVQRNNAAKEENDELVTELDEKIQDATAAIKDAEKNVKDKKAKAEEEPPPVDPSKTPEFRAWKSENPWFGVDEDRSDYAAVIIQRMARTGEARNFPGQKALLDEVARRVFEKLGDPDQDRQKVSKVDGGGRSGKTGGSGSGGNGSGSSDTPSFNDLPQDVKDAAARMAKKVVGPKGSGRAFSDLKSFQSYYAKKYREDNPNE